MTTVFFVFLGFRSGQSLASLTDSLAQAAMAVIPPLKPHQVHSGQYVIDLVDSRQQKHDTPSGNLL